LGAATGRFERSTAACASISAWVKLWVAESQRVLRRGGAVRSSRRIILRVVWPTMVWIDFDRPGLYGVHCDVQCQILKNFEPP
jgi:hypothetical protein